MILADPKTHDEWLEARKQGIGGSDAACIIGKNKYKSNVDLWREKVGISASADISDKPAVKYGKEAESHIRELFKLDYPMYEVTYHEFRLYANDENPFIYATLDGELREGDFRGILEIKTTTIQNASQWEEWDGGTPYSYYVQVLHQLIATGWDFAVLRAYIRYYKHGEINAIVRDYSIKRDEVLKDIEYLKNKEIKFWEMVQSKIQPALILPDI